MGGGVWLVAAGGGGKLSMMWMVERRREMGWLNAGEKWDRNGGQL